MATAQLRGEWRPFVLQAHRYFTSSTFYLLPCFFFPFSFPSTFLLVQDILRALSIISLLICNNNDIEKLEAKVHIPKENNNQ